MKREKLLEQFPIAGNGCVYLDSAASSLTPKCALGKMEEYYGEYRSNIHRGNYRLSMAASTEFEQARGGIGNFFGAGKGSLLFTKNATEAINLVAMGLEFGAKRNIVISAAEHHSNILPWLSLKKKGLIREVRVAGKGKVKGCDFSATDFEGCIDSDTALVSITAASNVLGNIMPVREIAGVAHEKGARVLVDAAQVAGHRELDLERTGADFAAVSGHKCFGPTGTGFLYVAEGAEFSSPLLGGGMVESCSYSDYSLHSGVMEAGTPDIGGVIGWAEGCRLLSSIGVGNIEAHERMLLKKAFAELEGAGARVFGPRDISAKCGLVSFDVGYARPFEVAVLCDEIAHICVRAGHHCAMPLVRSLGVPGLVRASFHIYNTGEDVACLGETLNHIRRMELEKGRAGKSKSKGVANG